MLIDLELKEAPGGTAAVEADASAGGALPAVPKAPGRAPTGSLVTQRFDDGSALYEDGLVYDPSSQKFRKPRPPAPEPPAQDAAAPAEGEGDATGVEEAKALRRVRTRDGARLFGQPIGSVITPDVRPPLTSVIHGGTDRRNPATSRARPLDARPTVTPIVETPPLGRRGEGRHLGPVMTADRAPLPLPPIGDDDKAKAQAIADFGSSKDPGSPLHTIRKRKAAVKFYAQKRDGLSKEDAAKLAEEYELEAIDSARKGNGIPKASVMKGRTPKGVETPAAAADNTHVTDAFDAIQAGNQRRAKRSVSLMTEAEVADLLSLFTKGSIEARRIHEWRTGEDVDPDDPQAPGGKKTPAQALADPGGLVGADLPDDHPADKLRREMSDLDTGRVDGVKLKGGVNRSYVDNQGRVVLSESNSVGYDGDADAHVKFTLLSDGTAWRESGAETDHEYSPHGGESTYLGDARRVRDAMARRWTVELQKRGFTVIDRPEGKSVEELIDLDMWEAFKLGLDVEAKDVCAAVETKAVRRVRTPEGAKKYGVPIGTIITPDLIAHARGVARAVNPPKPRVSPGAGRGANPEAPRLRDARRAAATARDRAGDAAADARIADREKLAALNKKRRAQGKPPVLKLPAARQRPAGGGYGVTKKAMNARGDGDRPMKAGAYGRGDPRNDPEYATYVQELQAKLDTAMAAGLDTETTHTVALPGGGRLYTADRAAEHLRIIDRIMANSEGVPSDRRAIMMGGLPGAGKSTFLRQHGAELGLDVDEDGNPTNAIVINPDEMKSLLLNGTDAAGNPLAPQVDGLQKGEMAELVHEESSHLANLLAERALADGKNVVFDITLGDGEKARKKYLTNDRGTGARDQGYSVDAVFVDGDLPTSLHRAGLRHKQPNDKTGERGYSGRFVRYEHIASQAVREPNAQTSDGQKPKSQNRLEYDTLVTDGTFDRAMRYDNVTGEFVTDARPEDSTAPDGAEDQGDLALIDEYETNLQDGGMLDLGDGWQIAEDSGEFWLQRDSDDNGGSTEVVDSFETVAELIESLRERGFDPNDYKVA